MIDIEIKNLKGISKLSYSIPDRSGVYVLTASNGCGKTSLLIAIDRIGNNIAFNNYSKPKVGASISYTVDGKTVKYTKKEQRWSPVPKNCGALLNKLHRDTYYLSATGYRLYQQEKENLKAKSHDAPSCIKNAMNSILDTTKFDDLKYITVVPKKGRQQNLHRNNILYIVKSRNEIYSESSFSLGERMLLNALDYISSVKLNSILLIDEIELALHPIAQVKFYDYLCRIASEKLLTIIISTHSSTLVKRASFLHYLDKDKGIIETNYNATPALVLKEVSIEMDNRPDFIFFVEDTMAETYMKYVLQEYRKIHHEDEKIIIKVIPVGGYKEVIKLMVRMQNVPPFHKLCLHSFLDKDVEDTINDIRKTKPNNDFIALLDRQMQHYDYLHITPELGVWDSLKEDSNGLITRLEKQYGKLMFSLNDMIKKIDESKTKQKPRAKAKDCISALCQEISEKLSCNVQFVIDCIFQSYVTSRFESADFKNDITEQLKKVLNKQ